jgi:hypothetical protein
VIPFSGFQEDIYAVDVPGQLPGRHARLIEEALRPGEAIQHLLICPTWDTTTRPFGITAPRASHALCLTEARLIVSRDHHRRRPEPTVFSIDRGSFVGLEFGEALLMSWLVLYVRRGGTMTREGFYFPRHGNDFVAALLRTWRDDWPAHDQVKKCRPGLAQGEVLQAAGHFHQRLLRPLLAADEPCWRVTRRPPIWRTQQGWFRSWPVGLAYWGTLLLTDRAFFHVWSEPPLGPTGYTFDHNLLCFSLPTLNHVECRAERVEGVMGSRLLLTFGGEGGRRLDILFPEEQAQVARQWEQELAALAAR